MNYSVTVKNYLMSDIDAMASTPEASIDSKYLSALLTGSKRS